MPRSREFLATVSAHLLTLRTAYAQLPPVAVTARLERKVLAAVDALEDLEREALWEAQDTTAP